MASRGVRARLARGGGLRSSGEYVTRGAQSMRIFA